MAQLNFTKDGETMQPAAKTETILDSGERREYPTGAVRDRAVGKGDMFSLPAAAMLRISKHYELGALKYSRLNYQKGIYISDFMDSALRHIFKYLAGMDDEDHLSAAAFNINGAIEMECSHPEMQDIEARKGKNTFPYVESAAHAPVQTAGPSYTCGDCRYIKIEPDDFGDRYLCMNERCEIDYVFTETPACSVCEPCGKIQ